MKFREMLTRGIDYNDVLLVPQYSNIDSRSNIDISSNLFSSTKLKIPVIIANMDTVVNTSVIYEAWNNGALGIMHRYDSHEDIMREVRELEHNYVNLIIPSIGVGDSQIELAKKYIDSGKVHALCIDIAHGDCELMVSTIKDIRKINEYFPIIAGNVVTPSAARRLIEVGANAIKVGIGPGFVCTTRKETGAGYPQLSAIMEMSPVIHTLGATLIADGGIRSTGDIVKALAAGADTVMSGYLFAASRESCKETYRGMASLEAQQSFKGSAKNIEGRSTTVETKGSIKDILQNIKEGIQSGFSYAGAHNITELRNNAEFVIIK